MIDAAFFVMAAMPDTGRQPAAVGQSNTRASSVCPGSRVPGSPGSWDDANGSRTRKTGKAIGIFHNFIQISYLFLFKEQKT